jgi:hypothetical protein
MEMSSLAKLPWHFRRIFQRPMRARAYARENPGNCIEMGIRSPVVDGQQLA